MRKYKVGLAVSILVIFAIGFVAGSLNLIPVGVAHNLEQANAELQKANLDTLKEKESRVLGMQEDIKRLESDRARMWALAHALGQVGERDYAVAPYGETAKITVLGETVRIEFSGTEGFIGAGTSQTLILR